MIKNGRFHLLPLLTWTAVWGIFFAPLLLGVARLPNGDFAGQFHAFGLFQMRQLAQGQFPLWSPGSFGGFPFAADTQSAVFYPLRWLMLFLSLPLPDGYSFFMLTLEGLVHIWLAGAFTYALAFDMTRQRTAALIAAMAFGLGGYLTSYPLLQLAVLETMTWLPLVLLLLRRGTGTVWKPAAKGAGEGVARSETSHSESSRPLPWLAAAGIVLGMAALAGHPQTFMHICYLAAAYFLFLTARARWTWRWRLGVGGGIAFVTVGIACIAVLPAWFYLRLATRSDVGYDFVSKGFPLLNYTHLLVPRTLSLWTPEYVGLLSLSLALFALWGRRRTTRAAEILFWGVVAAVSAWVSLGDKGILFQLIYRIAPGFSLFRQQERLVNLVSLSLALSAAQGFALWGQLEITERRALLQKVSLFMGGGLLLCGIILAMASPITNDDWLVTWARQLPLTAIIMALLWFSRKRYTDALLVGLLALDLFVPVRTAMNLQAQSPNVFWPRPEWLTTLMADGPGRIDSRQLFVANVGEIYNLEDIRGISPLKLQLVERFEMLPRSLRWQLLNVTHVLMDETEVEEGLTAVTPVTESIMPGETVAATLYRFEDALPRAWMSYQPIIVPDDETAFQAIQAPEFDPSQQVVLTEPAVNLGDVSLPETVPLMQTKRTATNQLSLAVKTAVPGILVVSEWAVPGWKAVVDGTAVSSITADYGLMAFPLTAGSHKITLRYMPPGLILGAVITAVTLLLTLIIAWSRQPIISRQPDSQRMPIPVPVLQWDWQQFAVRIETVLRQHWRLWLLGIVFMGFGLRLFGLGIQELRGDEAFNYLFAREPVAEIAPNLLSEGDPHSPLPYVLLHGWMTLAGDSEVALRFLSLLAGVLLLPLLAQLGRRIGGRLFALAATFTAALSQSLVWISQDVRNQYPLSILFIVAATLLLLQMVDEKEDGTLPNTAKRRFGGVRLGWGWLSYAVLCALAVYSHYSAAFALLGHGVYVLASRPHRKQFWVWAGSALLAALLFLPWAAAMFSRMLNAGHLSDPATPELANFLTVAGIEMLAGSAVSGMWLRWFFLGSLVLCVVGTRRLWRQHAGRAGLLLSWLVSTLLFIYLIRFNRATFNLYYVTVAAPAWWLLVVAGVQQLWDSRKGWQAGAAVFSFTIFAIVSGVSLRNYYTDPQFSRSRGYRPMAAHVAAQMQPGDLFLAHFPDPSLVYYLRNVDIHYIMQPSHYHSSAAETEQEMAQLAADYDRIWFVPAPGSVWDAENFVPTWLDTHMLRTQEAQYDRLLLSAYRPDHTFADVTHPMQRQLGDAILLDSVFVMMDGKPVEWERPFSANPGSQLAITLLWHASTPVETHYTVFVQVLDENGMLVTQDDSIPTKGVRPTTTWQPNETILDTHTLILPADRTKWQGQIIVGMYETETVERVLFEDGEDTAVIATIQVGE